jgi:hypothetical protein
MIYVSCGSFFLEFLCSLLILMDVQYIYIKIKSLTVKKEVQYVCIFLCPVFFMVVQIVTYARNKWRKEEEKKNSKSEKKKKLSLSRALLFFFQSHNNILCSNSCVVDHHTTSSSSSIELHKWSYVFRLTFSDSVCLTGFFFSFLDFFFYYSVALEEKRPCLLSLTPSFIHSFDLSRNNIQRTRRKKNNNISFMLGCNTIINIEQESFSYLLSKVENWSLFNLRLI